MLNRKYIAAAMGALMMMGPVHAQAQSAEDFYANREVQLIVGFNAGSTYDIYSRLLAEWLPRYLPGNVNIVTVNQPGAGGAVAANHLYARADRDGSVIGMIAQAAALNQVLGDETVNYDATEFNWLGRLTSVVEVTVVWETSPAKTVEEAMEHEVILAASSAGGLSERMPRVMNNVVGTQFNPILGYQVPSGGFLAMEQGEADGTHVGVQGLLTGTQAQWIAEGQMNVLVQYAQNRHPAFPDVPAMVEFGDNEEDQQVLSLFASTGEFGRSFMLPPGVPEDRVAFLREAFDRMTADPEFQAEMESRNLELFPMSGADLQQAIVDSVNVPEGVIARAIEVGN